MLEILLVKIDTEGHKIDLRTLECMKAGFRVRGQEVINRQYHQGIGLQIV